MSKAPSMPVFTDALIGDTTHLSIEEFGAYCMILMVTWRNNGQPLPDDDGRMARICRVSVKRWTERLRPVLSGFFDLSEGVWRQGRLEKEWNYVANLSAKQSEKGKKSAAAKALKNNDSASTAVPVRLQPEANPHTHTHTQEENYTPLPPAMDQLPPDGGEAGRGDLNETVSPNSKARKAKTYPENFERFWSVWPNDHMGRKQSAGKAGTFDAWKKACGRDEPERIIRGATVYAENYGKLRAKGSDRADQIPMPTTWLNQKRWDGFADPAPEAQPPASSDFEWTVYLETFAKCGVWPANKGPKPGEPGCQAPADLVARFMPPPPTAQIIVYPQQQRIAQ